jgi:hypothetical protein
VSPTLKGLKISRNMPLIIFEKAFWDANPIMAAMIPAPAKRAVPNVFNGGISIKMKIMAAVKMINVMEFFRNEKLVGSALNRDEYFFIKILRAFLNMIEATNAMSNVPIIKIPYFTYKFSSILLTFKLSIMKFIQCKITAFFA